MYPLLLLHVIAAFSLLLAVTFHILHFLYLRRRKRVDFGSGIRCQCPIDNKLDS